MLVRMYVCMYVFTEETQCSEMYSTCCRYGCMYVCMYVCIYSRTHSFGYTLLFLCSFMFRLIVPPNFHITGYMYSPGCSCTYTFLNMHAHICTYLRRLYACAHTQVCVRRCPFVCLVSGWRSVLLPWCKNLSTYSHIHACRRTYTDTYIRTYIHTSSQIHACKHNFLHTCIRTYTYAHGECFFAF